MLKLSLIIVSLVGGKSLVKFLESLNSLQNALLSDEQNNLTIEKIVFTVPGKCNLSELKKQFPTIQFIDKETLSVPIARKKGVELATGDVVALLEDTSLPGPKWFKAVIDAFSDDVVALGGPVELSSNLTGHYLALGCGEYGRFHPVLYPQLVTDNVDKAEKALIPVSRLPGNNLAYRRETVKTILAGSELGLIEAAVNETLQAAGHSLYLQPDMVVSYQAADVKGAKLKTRFNHGRLFAGNRVSGLSWSTRLSWFAKSALLPVVLTLRGWSNMRHAVRPVSWPSVMLWIVLMESSWSLGEAVGYLFGAGRSLDAWS